MASLFDIGRPTGAMAGSEAATDVRRQRAVEDQALERAKLDYRGAELGQKGQEQTQTIQQAKYEDWLRGEELRRESRAAGIEQAKAVQATEETVGRAVVERAKTEIEQEKLNRQKQQLTFQTEVDMLHQGMDDRRYDQVTRAYQFFLDGVKAGHPPEELYKLAYKELLGGADPVKNARWLESRGLTAQPTPEAINTMAGLSSYGMLNPRTTREAYLLDREWALRKAVAQAKARATGTDMRYDLPSNDEIKHIGNMLSGSITKFDEFEGGVDDAGNYTGERGKIVSTIANWSALGQMNNLVGDVNVTPIDYQRIGSDIVNYAKEDISEEGWFFGTNNTGDSFNGSAFMNTADTAMGILDTMRARKAAETGVDTPVYQLWKEHGQQIMGLIKQSNQRLGEENLTASPPAATGPRTGSDAGSAESAVDQDNEGSSTNPATATKQTASQRRQEINKIISSSGFKKFEYTDKGKVKTPAYQKLLDERKALAGRDKINFMDTGA